MTPVASAAEDLGYRPRRREARDVSHRFRRGPRLWTRVPFLVLVVAVAALLVFALRSEPPRSHPRVWAAIPPTPAVCAGTRDPRGRARARLPDPGGVVPRAAERGPPGRAAPGRGPGRRVPDRRRTSRALPGALPARRTARMRTLSSPACGTSASPRGWRTEPSPSRGSCRPRTPTTRRAGWKTKGIAVRVEEENRAVAYHVVRVGAYETAEAAERGRDELAARGLSGLVVRVQPAGRLDRSVAAGEWYSRSPWPTSRSR